MENIQALLESTKYSTLSASDSAAMRLMLENTEKEHQRLVNEGTLSGDVAQFTPILMPMVRRVYPNLIANELLGVQPMSMPTGFIYALTNRYVGTGVKGAKDAFIYLVDDASGLQLSGDVVYIEGNYVLSNEDVAVGGTISDGEGTPNTATVSAKFSNEASFGKILKGYTATVAAAANGASTAEAEALSTNMKEIGFDVSKKSVEAKSRALKGQYTVEMYQDLKAQHGLLADEEIMSLMSYEMQAEIDREVVDFVNSNATILADTAYGTPVGGSVSAFAVSSASGRFEIEKYRHEAIRLSKEAAQIGLDTKRGQGNTLLVSPKVATMLEQLGGYQPAKVNGSVKAPISGGVAGTFDGRFKVIVDQYATSDYATVLYKGADRRDAMGFFAPYVPMSFTKVTNADSGQPAVIAKTRYAIDTIPGVESATSNDRAKTYARSYGISFASTVLA